MEYSRFCPRDRALETRPMDRYANIVRAAPVRFRRSVPRYDPVSQVARARLASPRRRFGTRASARYAEEPCEPGDTRRGRGSSSGSPGVERSLRR